MQREVPQDLYAHDHLPALKAVHLLRAEPEEFASCQVIRAKSGSPDLIQDRFVDRARRAWSSHDSDQRNNPHAKSALEI